MDGEPARRLLSDESNLAYAPGGPGSDHDFLFFVREGVLMAQAFDLDQVRLVGDAFALSATPAAAGRNGNYAFAASATGLLAYVNSADASPRRLVWVDRSGNDVGAPNLAAPGLRSLRLSPDGRRVAYSSFGAGSNGSVWVYDLEREARTLLSDVARGAGTGTWSPDGSEIAFATESGVVTRSADGAGSPINLPIPVQNSQPSDWSTDGRYLVYRWQSAETDVDLWFLERKGDGADWEPHAFLTTPSTESRGQLSPNGRYLAYTSDESGRIEVYVQAFPEGGRRSTISTEGGDQPLWSRDGKELYFLTPNEELVAAQVTTEGEFSVSAYRKLFRRSSLSDTFTLAGNNYDVSLDGQRFLLAEPTGDESPSQDSVSIVQNWLAKYTAEQ